MADDTTKTPPATPPEDPRPQPRFGELAPEGWSWQPPKDDRALPEQAVTPAPVPVPTPAPAPPARPGGTTRIVPNWDRPLTLGLLIFGLLATFFTVSMLNAVPVTLQVLYTQEDLGTYTPDPSVAGLLTAGAVIESVLWLVTAAISILMTVRRRRTFYIPLIGGVVSVIVLFVFMGAVLMTDPTLLDTFGQP